MFFFLYGVRGCVLLIRCVALCILLYALVLYYLCFFGVVCSFCRYVVLSVCLISGVFLLFGVRACLLLVCCVVLSIRLYALVLYYMCFFVCCVSVLLLCLLCLCV